MSWNDHDHRGEYAETSHAHSFWDLDDVAEKHHRHYDDENTMQGLREDLGRAEEHIRDLEAKLDIAFDRIRALAADTPQARQLQLEADLAAADAHEFDRHGSGCDCSYCGIGGEEPW
jgi:hypothetical protein